MKQLTNEVPRDTIAHRVENTIESTYIVDGLLKPHDIFILPTTAIFFMRSFFSNLLSLVAVSSGRVQDQSESRMREKVWFVDGENILIKERRGNAKQLQMDQVIKTSGLDTMHHRSTRIDSCARVR